MKKIIYTLCLSFFTIALFGQNPNDTTKISDLYLDFAVPDLGAFTLLGVSPQSAIRPGTPKELGTQILNVAGNGKFIQPGVAVDWSPIQTFGGKYMTYNDFMKKSKKLLRAFQLTFGTVADTGGTKVGYGLKWVLWDNSDPLRDYNFYRNLTDVTHMRNLYELNNLQGQFASSISNFLSDLLDTYRNKTPDAQENASLIAAITGDTLLINKLIFPTKKPAQNFANKGRLMTYCDSVFSVHETRNGCQNCITPMDPLLRLQLENIIMEYRMIIDKIIYYHETISNNVDTLKKEYKKEHWNSFCLQIGLGSVASSIDNTWDKLNNTSFKTYLSACGPFSKKRNSDFLKSSEWILSTSYEHKYNAVNTDSSTKTILGVAARFLWAPNDFRVSLDCGLNLAMANKTDYNKNFMRVTAGFEYKISDGNWVELVFGIDEPVENWQKSSNIIALGSFKHSINKEKRDLSRKR